MKEFFENLSFEKIKHAKLHSMPILSILTFSHYKREPGSGISVSKNEV